MKYLTFQNGKKMPILGIGTWQAPDSEVEAALDEALTAGYRHIDCAPVYMNEKAIGRVLNKWLSSGQLKREELFVTTKLPPPAIRPEFVENTLRASLRDLQLDYVDLYLVHCPFTVQFNPQLGEFVRHENGDIKLDSTDHIAVWKKMEELVSLGLTQSIGVSNFNISQIDRILKNCSIEPANLQIEYHVYLQQPELIEFCKSKNITITAYSPLGSRGIINVNKQAGIDAVVPNLIELPEVKELATKYEKTSAQILLRWIIQHDISAIPKSTNAERLRQNLNIFDFELNEADMQKLNGLDRNFRICDFKFLQGVDKHTEFPF